MTPPGWSSVTLRDIASDISYGFTASASDVANGPKMLRITDIQDNRVDWNTVPRCECDATDKYLLHPGDIVIARTGATTGKSFLLGDVPEASVFASYLIRVQPSAAVVPAYLASYMQSPSYWAQITTVSKGTAQPGANASILGGLELPLAPVEEQRRIVAKLQALQSRSRRAREALDAVPPLLEKLRQSILAAAFRGDLTADWRAQNPNTEPATALLARIRTDRRKKWEEAELAKLKAKGKTPTDDKWKAKYKEPEPIHTAELPVLPDGWCWTSSSSLSTDIVDCPHSTPRYGDGSFFAVDTTCIVPGSVVIDRLRRVDRETYISRTARLIPEAGDIIFAREGTVGTAVSLPESPQVCLGQRVMLLRPSSLLTPRWLERALMSPPVTLQYRRRLVGSTVPHLNVADVVRLAVPVPPAAEQRQVLTRVLAWEGFLNSVEAECRKARPSLTSFEAALLAKAFRGELVPQDSNDEPADITLSRAPTTSTEAPRRRARRAKAAE